MHWTLQTGSYEINFYLDAEEEEGSEAGDMGNKEHGKMALLVKVSVFYVY